MGKIGFGGSCHWCTEAIFRSLKGVNEVQQGWIASEGENTTPSEAVIVHFEPSEISLETLIVVHLHTHSCTAEHTMRSKYRCAVYTFTEDQAAVATRALHDLAVDFEQPIITRILPFQSFKLNEKNYLDYYYKDPSKPFCQNIVNPKLKELLAKFADHIAPERRAQLNSL